ncbi:MAG: hypothetical protein O8C63_06185 [Candidatus Methanoperedens sp.]|nr:hypothetical protein [Candidatus Methanoperedens sp.]
MVKVKIDRNDCIICEHAGIPVLNSLNKTQRTPLARSLINIESEITLLKERRQRNSGKW